jgi:hypothetical protein
MDMGYNTSTLALRVVRGDIKETWPSRFGGVSDETVKYGYGFCTSQTIE